MMRILTVRKRSERYSLFITGVTGKTNNEIYKRCGSFYNPEFGGIIVAEGDNASVTTYRSYSHD